MSSNIIYRRNQMKIILVRHGETQWNALGKLQGREDVPLSETGRLQAKATGKALSQYPFSGRGPVIISSPLQRAVETARLVAAELPMTEEIYTNEVLLERDYGAGSGLTREERERLYPDDDFPGLEDRMEAERRIVQGIKLLARKAKGRDLVLVSHGEISHIFLARLRGETTQTGRSALQNASISTLEYDEETGLRIEYYNKSARELTEILDNIEESRKYRMNIPIVLASASPRRKELLGLITPDFETMVSQAEEQAKAPQDMPLEQLPGFFAQVKAEDIAKNCPEKLVIGSDTGVLVAVEDGKLQMLGKPVDAADAHRMLRMLSGKKHLVSTGCCLCYKGQSQVFVEIAEVEFYELTDAEIEAYIATNEPMDKAGAYGIQGYGALLVKGIVGDFYTIMGLPVARLKREMSKIRNK